MSSKTLTLSQLRGMKDSILRTMTPNSTKAIKKVILHEGGDQITEDPDDPGGLTKFGISKNSFPLLDIRNLTESDATAIYKKYYWDLIRGNEIKSYNVAFAIFDQAVNRGVYSASKQAQKVAGVSQDGKIGPASVNAINSKGEESFLAQFLAESINIYNQIIARRPASEKYRDGWMNRVQSIADYVGVQPAAAIASGFVLLVGVFF